MTGGRVVVMLSVLASIATILGFLINLGSSSSTPPQPQPDPITAVSSAGPTGSAYPASAENNFLSTCQQNAGLSTSHCQCDLTWLEANYPYSLYSALYGADSQSAVNEAEAYANCPS